MTCDRRQALSKIQDIPARSLSLYLDYISICLEIFSYAESCVSILRLIDFSSFFPFLSFVSLFLLFSLAFSELVLHSVHSTLSSPLSSSFVRPDKYRDRPPPARASSGVPTDSHFGNARHYSPFIGFADFSAASRGDAPMHRLSPQRPRIRNNAVTYRRSLRNGEQ